MLTGHLGLRKSPWLDLLGPDYVEMAFRAAAKADPRAMLVYNENHLDYDIPEERAKQEAVLRLLDKLKSAGVPIHALGVQAHLRADERRFARRPLAKFLRDAASLGLKILITEMDVVDQSLPAATDLRDKAVAKIYEDYLSALLLDINGWAWKPLALVFGEDIAGYRNAKDPFIQRVMANAQAERAAAVAH